MCPPRHVARFPFKRTRVRSHTPPPVTHTRVTRCYSPAAGPPSPRRREKKSSRSVRIAANGPCKTNARINGLSISEQRCGASSSITQFFIEHFLSAPEDVYTGCCSSAFFPRRGPTRPLRRAVSRGDDAFADGLEYVAPSSANF